MTLSTAWITSRFDDGRPGAQVVEEARARRSELGKHRDVRPAQVVHMDIIAQTRAVGGGVVGAEELQVRPLADRHVDRDRDQVGLRVVVLADAAVLGGAGRVEVPKGGETEAVGDRRAL